jgi:arginyl-tRNA synthetase
MESYIRLLFLEASDEIIKETNIDASKYVYKSEYIKQSIHADYAYTGLIPLYQLIKSKVNNLKIIADKLIEKIKDKDTKSKNIIHDVDFKQPYINIMISNKYLYYLPYKFIKELDSDVFEKSIFAIEDLSTVYNNSKIYRRNTLFDNMIEINRKKNIIVDYSSPNVAKSLHIGHLRSTIIGESIVRLLKAYGHKVSGINHVGDCGTQFGMIIKYLLETGSNEVCESDSHNLITEYLFKKLDNIGTNELTEIYKNAKKKFDTDSMFANASRAETFKLQKGLIKNINLATDEAINVDIWERLCDISSKEYNNIYKLLNIKHLIERGESYYLPLIPYVIKELELKGLIKEENGAKLIMLDEWTYPLIIVKSDGAYTYDTTDICTLYHRLCILNTDQIIYITDIGQKSHFDMCFKVAEVMGWKGEKKDKILTHIGFGVVCGSDGKKLKTRSGETVRMMDVIDEVISKSNDVIKERIKANPDDQIYKHMDESEISHMSQIIGINTLKYFDLSHSFESSYKYDPEIMFRFQGDTGVYLMYCYARINGIIKKSTLDISLDDQNKITKILKQYIDKIEDLSTGLISKETHDLLMHIANFGQTIEESVQNLNTNNLTKYLFSLCTLFNAFISQKDGKIIGSENELFGICVCICVSKIIKVIFNILSFEHVDHI